MLRVSFFLLPMDYSSFNLVPGPIGIFDSGYGGLTILEKIREELPEYEYIYLGDNARTPYGSRSFEIVYEFTLQAVKKLFEMDCPLVILACNTASAKALRSIQQLDLPNIAPDRRVLGVIRPTIESIDQLTRSRHVGLLGTIGTVRSESYPMEIEKLFPDIKVESVACPMWVPLIENKEYNNPGADYFVEKYVSELLDKDPDIDTIILGCTHYPLLIEKIRKYTPPKVKLLAQGEYVAKSLADYLRRHPEIESKCKKGGKCNYLTTESAERFAESASVFLRDDIEARSIQL